MLAIADAQKHMKEGCNFVVTGNPVRSEIISADKAESRKKLGLDERPVVLSFGGSLGAQRVNEACADIIARSGKDGRYQHIHAYGQYGHWFPDLVKEKGTDISQCSNLDIREYIDNMPRRCDNDQRNSGSGKAGGIYSVTERCRESSIP